MLCTMEDKTKQLAKNGIDSIWNEFRPGGVANPLSALDAIEQVPVLMFARLAIGP